MTGTNEAVARLEKELLARLGLGAGASNEQIESAHEEIADYLDKAPGALRDWAARQSAGIDEAYALLRGSRDDLKDAALARAAATAAAAAAVTVAEPAPAPRVERAPTPARAASKAAPGVVLPHGGRHNMDALDSDETWYDEEDLQPGVRNTRHAREARAAAAAAPRGGINPTLRRAGLALGAIVAVVAIAFAGYSAGSPKATPAPSADADAAAFSAQVATLMQKLSANPNDTATLLKLGTLYYENNDFATAINWMKKVLAIDPNNVDALLAYGAASYNASDYATAEATWKKVIQLDPKSLEAYYDLGFLYFTDNPPNVDLVKQMWGKVIEIAPDSQTAKTVKSHLDSLTANASVAPAASGAATAAPSAAASAAPKASTAPSAAASPAPSK